MSVADPRAYPAMMPPMVCSAIFGEQAAAERGIVDVFARTLHWREARLYQIPSTGRFRVDMVHDVIANPVNPELVLVAIGSACEWLSDSPRRPAETGAAGAAS